MCMHGDAMKLVIISTGRNSGQHQETLCNSIDCQTDTRWEHVLVDDASDSGLGLDPTMHLDERRSYVVNDVRKWALQNIVDVARRYQHEPDVVIGTVDCDDELCESRTVELVLKAYEDAAVDVVWTAHRWDVRPDMNVSRAMPDDVDPYEWPWCTSHFRTFRASLLSKISDDNFLDSRGHWFRRGYDQCLMLPLLKVGRRRKYIDIPCYTYRIDSCSIPIADRPGSEVEQCHNVAFVRARGFIQ
jgi:hypothetical protein